MKLLIPIIMLSFFNKTPEEKLDEYNKINNQSYLKFRPLDTQEMKIDYISVFNPSKRLSNVNLLSNKNIDSEDPIIPQQSSSLGDIAEEAVSKTGIAESKMAVKVKPGDSIKNYQDNKFFNSILNLNLPNTDKEYLLQMGYLESRYNPKADNKRGYQGAYQFGNTALKEVGMTKHQYLGNMNNQHIAALKLRDSNLNALKAYQKYIGKFVNGIRITASGLAAGAHLVGASAVKKFFDEGIIERDGNGTPITKYFQDFSHIG